MAEISTKRLTTTYPLPLWSEESEAWALIGVALHPEIERPRLFSNQEWKSLYNEAKALFRTTDTAFDYSIRHQLVKDTLIHEHKDREFVSLPLACERSPFNPEHMLSTGPAQIP